MEGFYIAKRYIENNLNKNEHVVLEAKISWLTLVPSFIWLVLMFVVAFVLLGKIKVEDKDAKEIMALVKIGLLVIGFIPLLLRIIRNKSTNLAVTNKRVIGKTGVLKISTIDFHIDKVDNVSYRAGFFGNLFHYYTVEVKGGGDAKKSPFIPGISNAADFKNAVNEAVEVHAFEGRKEQAKLIGEAMVEALEKSAIQFTCSPKAAPKAKPAAKEE